MKSIIPALYLLIGATAGFASGQWRGEAITLRAYAHAAEAPGVDPVYVSEVADADLARARAKITVKGR